MTTHAPNAGLAAATQTPILSPSNAKTRSCGLHVFVDEPAE